MTAGARSAMPARLSTLHIALGVSLAVHAALLTVRFVDPEGFNRVFQDTPLEVILVNAKSQETPDQAQAIAQASLAGGGEAATPKPRAGQARERCGRRRPGGRARARAARRAAAGRAARNAEAVGRPLRRRRA